MIDFQHIDFNTLVIYYSCQFTIYNVWMVWNGDGVGDEDNGDGVEMGCKFIRCQSLVGIWYRVWVQMIVLPGHHV